MSKPRNRFPVTVHIFLLRQKHVLLLRRQNTGFADGLFSVVAGHIEGNERVQQAARREAAEEVGIELRVDDLHFAGVMHRREGQERIDFFFSIHIWHGEPANKEPDKCSELRWVPIDMLPEDTIPYIREAVRCFRQAEFFMEYGWEKAALD
jgi:ADP-ribose pyrophosphatase YjhB (NUDIX family)